MAVPAKASESGLAGNVHLLPSLVVVVTLGGDAQCPCSAPVSPLQIGSKAYWHGVLAGQLMRKLSLVAKCVFMPVPLQRASFVAPCHQLLSLPPALLSSETARGEAAGSFRFRVLVQHPCPKLLAEMPPTTNSSEGVSSPGCQGLKPSSTLSTLGLAEVLLGLIRQL